MSDEILIRRVGGSEIARQIRDGDVGLDRILERAEDIGKALREGVRVATRGLTELNLDESPWEVREFEVSFGIAVSAEAGIIVSRFGGEASFEVTVKVAKEP